MADETGDADELLKLGQALRKLRRSKGMSMETSAHAFGLTSGESWRKYEAGLNQSLFQPSVQRRLTEVLGYTPEDLAAARGEDETSARRNPFDSHSAKEPELTLLPVRDRVQAGAWLQADDYVQTLPKRYTSARDPRFPNAEQWLCEVVGDSVDQLNIFDGDLVHCVDVIGAGYYPKTGDVVEVVRTRFGGMERELTIKQVEVITPDKVLLWPRSSNPRHQSPLAVEGLEGEDVEVRIRGLVIAAIRRFSA